MIKIKKKLQKPYLTEYNFLIAQNLWQAHNEILKKILLMKFGICKIKCKYGQDDKKVKLEELNTNILTAF